MRNTLRAFLIAFGLLAVPAAWGQPPVHGSGGLPPAEPVTFTAVLTGKVVPLAIKAQDMDTTWSRFYLAGQGGGEVEVALLAALQIDPGNIMVYYTRGQILTIGAESYLVAYSPPVKLPSARKTGMPGEVKSIEPLTPDTSLGISLLNTHTCGSMLAIHPVEGGKEVAVVPPDIKPPFANNPPPAGANPPPAGVNPPPAGANPPPAVVIPLPPPDDEKLQKISMNNLSQLAMKILNWAQEHNENLPPMKDVAVLKASLKADEKLYFPPGSKEAYQFNSSLSNVGLGDIPNTALMALVYEANPAPDGKRAVAYLDGHTERVTEVKWAAVKKASGIADQPAPAPGAAAAPAPAPAQ